MKLFKYCLSFSFLICGCADATPKLEVLELVCPSVLPAEKDFPASWVILGKVTSDKLLIREADFIDANATQEKERLLGVKERVFSRDSLDEWVDYDDRSEATTEYFADHADAAMMCTYSKTQKEMFDVERNVVLLIPLPPKKHLTCLIVRREVNPLYELSCRAK